jgi:hypothetical protein
MASDFQAVIGLVFVGGGFLVHAIKAHRKIRLIEDTPRSKAESAPQGFVELQGFAWPAEETFRNGEDQEVVYYSLLLQRQETRGSGKSRRKEWVTVYTHVHSEMFYLADPTGLVALDIKDAELNLESARTRHWSKLEEKEKLKLQAVIPNDIPGFPPSTGLFGLFSSPYRIVENEILVGCPLYASGDFKGFEGETYNLKLQGLSGFGDKVFDRAARAFKDRSRILDSNKDGKVSCEEYRKGSAITARVARKSAGADMRVESEFPVHGNLGSSGNIKLFLADTSEEYLKERMSKWLWPKFGAGAAMLALGLALAIHPGTLNFKKINKYEPIHNAAAAPALRASDSRSPANIQHAMVLRIHGLCVNGDLIACRSLVDHSAEYHLPQANLDFYKRKLATQK